MNLQSTSATESIWSGHRVEAREHAEARKNQAQGGGGEGRGQIHMLVLSHFIVAKLPGRPGHLYDST